ncbi:reverse transcriptase domain-containing protein [Tanacetum coccineum]
MVLATTSLTGFSGETIWPLGQLRLLVTIGDADHSIKAWMNFMIVRSLSPYNGIIGRPRIREIQAVPSTAHVMLKFLVDGGIATICSTILIPAECAMVITSSKEIPKETGVRHENFKVALHPNFPYQEVAIRGTLSAKKRGQALERTKAIQAEVQKLVAARIMREVYYHEWLSNPVMVKKHDGSWRMCMDFTDLNKAWPHDYYPLPEIDWKAESLSGYPFKCFLDVYKGYYQIHMAESDEEKIAFHTSHGVYCYTKMPFSLKNAGTTYQRLVDKAFDSQVGQNIEVYVNDLVIKSYIEAEMLRDINETFHVEQSFKQLKQHLSELPLLVAPKPKEELIVYLSGSHGAIIAVLMTERGTVQMPVYFVSRALQGPELNYTPMEKLVLSLVFAAKRLRRYFQAHPIVVITDQPIKQIMLRPDVAGRLKNRTSCRENTISHTGQGHRSSAGLILASPEGTEFTYALRFQFTALNNEVEYEALIASLRIAAQMGVRNVHILADFLVEKSDESPPDASVVETPQKPWTFFTDGSSCVDGSGVGLILTSPEGTKFTYELRFQFAALNNEVEYEALIASLRIAAQMGVRNVHVNVDSKLVANQVLGTYVAKEENMVKYLEKAKSLISGFANFP